MNDRVATGVPPADCHSECLSAMRNLPVWFWHYHRLKLSSWGWEGSRAHSPARETRTKDLGFAPHEFETIVLEWFSAHETPASNLW